MKIFSLFFLLFSFSVFAADPVPYTVYFRAGKRLIRLADKTEYFVPKGMYVKVLELDPKRRDQFYVYDKSGKAVYITDATDLIEVAEDVRLLPSLDAEKIYPPKSVFRAENKTANFDSQFSVHFDNLGLQSLNEIYADDINSVLSTRYEARTIYLSDSSFHFGLSLNYQSAYWKNDIEEVKISILSFGPIFQYNIVHDDDLKVKALMSAETAPIYTGITAKNKDDFSALLFDVGLESEWETPVGFFSLGGHFRHHELKLRNTTRININLPPKEYSLNSIGATIGYKYEWSL